MLGCCTCNTQEDNSRESTARRFCPRFEARNKTPSSLTQEHWEYWRTQLTLLYISFCFCISTRVSELIQSGSRARLVRFTVSTDLLLQKRWTILLQLGRPSAQISQSEHVLQHRNVIISDAFLGPANIARKVFEARGFLHTLKVLSPLFWSEGRLWSFDLLRLRTLVGNVYNKCNAPVTI